MILIVDLFIRAHEPYARVIVVTFCSIAVIPLTVELYEIPVVAVGVDRESLDHHVRNACAVEEHFRAGKIYVTVTAAL